MIDVDDELRESGLILIFEFLSFNDSLISHSTKNKINTGVFGCGIVLRKCNVLREFKYFEVNSIVWVKI